MATPAESFDQPLKALIVLWNHALRKYRPRNAENEIKHEEAGAQAQDGIGIYYLDETLAGMNAYGLGASNSQYLEHRMSLLKDKPHGEGSSTNTLRTAATKCNSSESPSPKSPSSIRAASIDSKSGKRKGRASGF